MNKEIGCIYFLICFSLAIFVIVPILNNSAFGFLQTTDTANLTDATNAANAANAANTTNAANAANTANTTATNSTQITNSVQINSSNTKATTDGKSLNIDLQIQPFPVTKNADTQFMIKFLQPSTQSVQVHVDYDFAITKMNSEVFRASTKTGQPLLHTAEGIVKIPYKFDQPGQYSIQVSVMGINFIPIKTEQALFDLKVS